MKHPLRAYWAHINIRNVCLESTDVITFPSSINPNMQMSALKPNTSLWGTFDISFMWITAGKKKQKKREMAKTNKNTHKAQVWTLLRLCIITLQSTLPEHHLLPVSTEHIHTVSSFSLRLPCKVTKSSLVFSLRHTNTLAHTPTGQCISKELCGSAANHCVHKGEIFSSFLTQAAEVLIALLSWQNFQGKRCYPWWISTVATSDWFFQLGHVTCISYISLRSAQEGESEWCGAAFDWIDKFVWEWIHELHSDRKISSK